MKAMVLREYNKDLLREDVPDPTPRAGEIVLRLKACGMCFTDVKIVTGQLGDFVSLPHVPGHEIAGEVVEIGAGVGNVSIGDRGVAYFILSCGCCEFCLSGRQNLCAAIRRLGFEEHGGYAQYVRMPAANFCPFPADASFAAMAVVPDAVATPYHALVNMAGVRAGQKVLIVGAGGLGLNAVQIGVMMGLRVTVADINDAALAMAKEYGAEHSVNSGKAEPLAALRECSGGLGFDAVLEGVGYSATMAWSLRSLKKDGTCVIMGYDPVQPVPVRLIDMHNNQWRLAGTKVSTLNGLREAVDLVARGKIKPLIRTTIALEEVNRALTDLRKGGGVGRTVITEF